MKTIIHVNQHVIKDNAKTGARNPTLTVKTYKSNIYATSVSIEGPSRLYTLQISPYLAALRYGLKQNLT